MGLGISSTGSVRIDAPVAVVWGLVTDYERHPQLIPNILSTRVRRGPRGVELDQVGLLSNKLQLKCEMRLAVAEEALRSLRLQRLSGHGFLDFQAAYYFQSPTPESCLLTYEVKAFPCPVFPMPIVEGKIRKEVPRMLDAVRTAAHDAHRGGPPAAP